MELIEGSETSAIRTQTPGNYPKENILHIENGESLKSRIQEIYFEAAGHRRAMQKMWKRIGDSPAHYCSM